MYTLKNTSNILRTDSYKPSHWLQYPEGTTQVYSYLESRGGQFNKIVFVGLNYYLKEYLSVPITMDDVNYADERITKHIGKGIFNRAGWERIVNVHGGIIPVKIEAVPEGTVVETGNVLMTVTNTDPQLPWVTNYVETLLMKVWYPITVATTSFHIKQLILKYLNETGDPNSIDFKLHDFGYRGVSSEESAAIGGFAHLTNFKGSDTILALEFAKYYYNEDMAGFSIPAAEHSTIISYGEQKEVEAYENMINKFGNGSLYAVVSDSYDIYNACKNIWGNILKRKVLAAPGVLVIRPDSGIPHEVVLNVVEILGDKFGSTINDKGFKVLNKVRVIQGDGIDYDEIEKILHTLKIHNWSADNIAFGMGGALLQKCNRDTSRFAFKASSVTINGYVKEICKTPKTDKEKSSKKGKLKLIYNTDTQTHETINIHCLGNNILQSVWENGKLLIDPTLQEIRERVSKNL